MLCRLTVIFLITSSSLALKPWGPPLANDTKYHIPVVDPEGVGKNWTTCDEFLNGTEFDVMRVIDVDWKIFYFWVTDEELGTYNVRFHLPTRTLVSRFRDQLQDFKPPINWTAAELFMETTIDFSALFVRVNSAGLYRLVPSLSFDISRTPYLVFGLKIIEPSYLGIQNCQTREVFGLAPAENMPKQNEMETIAATFNIRATLHWSYIEKEIATPAPALVVVERNHNDDRDDDLYDQDLEAEKIHLI